MRYGTVVRVIVTSIVLASSSTGVAADRSPAILKSLDDGLRNRVYVLARDGVVLLDANTRNKLAHIDLPGWVWAGESYSCPPAIALAPDGDVLVTSNVLPIIWRIEHRTLAMTVHGLVLDRDRDKDIGFTSLHWSRNLRTYIGMTNSGARWHIDPALSTARKVANAPAERSAKGCREWGLDE